MIPGKAYRIYIKNELVDSFKTYLNDPSSIHNPRKYIISITAMESLWALFMSGEWRSSRSMDWLIFSFPQHGIRDKMKLGFNVSPKAFFYEQLLHHEVTLNMLKERFPLQSILVPYLQFDSIRRLDTALTAREMIFT